MLVDKLLKTKHSNKYLYDLQLNTEVNIKNNSEEKWDNELERENTEWNKIYMVPIICTIYIKLREFQYKFLKRIVPTNTFLFKCKISNSNLCEFCSRDNETVKHLFWECNKIQHFWSQIKTFLMNSNIDITIDYLNICLGYTKAHVHSKLINFIILSAKYFIFKNKYMKTIPDIAAYKSYLNKRIEIEQHIAFQKDKLDQHNAKWQKLVI